MLDADQWGYVVENYRKIYRGRAYVEQMNRLNEFIDKNPDAAYAFFLRGYQHGFLGHHKSALRDLNKVIELESRDELATQLIKRFGGTPPSVNTSSPDNLPAADSDGREGHNYDSRGQNQEPTTNAQFSAILLSDLNIPLVAGNPSLGKSGPADVPTLDAPVLAATPKLSLADRTAALAQRTCPVTGDILDSDGTPIKVDVGGRKVFVCCEGCIEELKQNHSRLVSAP